MPEYEKKCLLTVTQGELLVALADYGKEFTVPEIESYLREKGRAYNRQVLYENLDGMLNWLLKKAEPQEIEGRLVKTYRLSELGQAWSWWLSLSDQAKIKGGPLRWEVSPFSKTKIIDQLEDFSPHVERLFGAPSVKRLKNALRSMRKDLQKAAKK